jgi:hypothetical protein
MAHARVNAVLAYLEDTGKLKSGRANENEL